MAIRLWVGGKSGEWFFQSERRPWFYSGHEYMACHGMIQPQGTVWDHETWIEVTHCWINWTNRVLIVILFIVSWNNRVLIVRLLSVKWTNRVLTVTLLTDRSKGTGRNKSNFTSERRKLFTAISGEERRRYCIEIFTIYRGVGVYLCMCISACFSGALSLSIYLYMRFVREKIPDAHCRGDRGR